MADSAIWGRSVSGRSVAWGTAVFEISIDVAARGASGRQDIAISTRIGYHSTTCRLRASLALLWGGGVAGGHRTEHGPSLEPQRHGGRCEGHGARHIACGRGREVMKRQPRFWPRSFAGGIDGSDRRCNSDRHPGDQRDRRCLSRLEHPAEQPLRQRPLQRREAGFFYVVHDVNDPFTTSEWNGIVADIRPKSSKRASSLSKTPAESSTSTMIP